MMKNSRLMCHAALVAMSCFLAAACSDDNEDKGQTSTQKPEAKPDAAAVSAAPQSAAGAPVAEDDIRSRLPEEVAALPWVQVQEIALTGTAQEGGRETVQFDLTLLLKEDLCEPAEVPSQLKELLEKMNPVLNKAMTPESRYLLQVGADPSEITPEDTAMEPLPPELQESADALKRLAEPAAYKVAAHAGETVVLHGSMTRQGAGKEGAPGEWEKIVVDTEPLAAWKKASPQSALPEGHVILSAAWVAARSQEIEAAVAEWEKAAAPYIASRENAARARMLEARAQEEARKAKIEKQAEELRRERARFEQATAAGKTYEGEWALDEQGGKLALTIVTCEPGERSAMLTANLSDPDLPQASVELKGRCLLLPEEGEKYRFQIAIIDGLYDPDAATAKIYDATDGLLLLNLAQDGSLEGVLTCKSWGEAEKDQVVRVVLKPSVKSKKKTR